MPLAWPAAQEAAAIGQRAELPDDGAAALRLRISLEGLLEAEVSGGPGVAATRVQDMCETCTLEALVALAKTAHRRHLQAFSAERARVISVAPLEWSAPLQGESPELLQQFAPRSALVIKGDPRCDRATCWDREARRAAADGVAQIGGVVEGDATEVRLYLRGVGLVIEREPCADRRCTLAELPPRLENEGDPKYGRCIAAMLLAPGGNLADTLQELPKDGSVALRLLKGVYIGKDPIRLAPPENSDVRIYGEPGTVLKGARFEVRGAALILDSVWLSGKDGSGTTPPAPADADRSGWRALVNASRGARITLVRPPKEP